MIGGMTPPCAIALATLLFKNKFTKSEREAGPTNFIMGLAFITEGAIPYAAADPLHVIPACVIGSGVAGALSMLFKCTLMAPHWRYFRISCSRKCNYVFTGTCDWNGYFYCFIRCVEEAKRSVKCVQSENDYFLKNLERKKGSLPL
mgnify:CR=1 FL=1